MKQLARLLRLLADRIESVDSWKHSGGFYVSEFKEQFEKIAAALSAHCEEAIHTRFNLEQRCVELYIPGKDVIARVNVQGECCSASIAIITGSLSRKAKKIFTQLPLELEFSTVA